MADNASIFVINGTNVDLKDEYARDQISEVKDSIVDPLTRWKMLQVAEATESEYESEFDVFDGDFSFSGSEGAPGGTITLTRAIKNFSLLKVKYDVFFKTMVQETKRYFRLYYGASPNNSILNVQSVITDLRDYSSGWAFANLGSEGYSSLGVLYGAKGTPVSNGWVLRFNLRVVSIKD